MKDVFISIYGNTENLIKTMFFFYSLHNFDKISNDLICLLISVVIFSCSEPVREFFCYDDPPGAHDSLEESKVCVCKCCHLSLQLTVT